MTLYAFSDFDSAVAFVDRHRDHCTPGLDGVVEVLTEYRCSPDPDRPSLTYILSIVCPGHYSFEREGDSLADLWAQAGAYYGGVRSTYKGGCDRNCLSAAAHEGLQS